jgi:hypothetical protein
MSEDLSSNTAATNTRSDEQIYQAEINRGIACSLLLNAFFAFACAGMLALPTHRSSRALVLALEFLGFVQAVYIVPVLAIAWLIKLRGFCKGLLMGSGIVFLLSGICATAILFNKLA